MSIQDLKFVHITKTAGTSIENFGRTKGVLWGYQDRNNLFKYKYKVLKNVSPWHIPLDYFITNPYKNYETFIIVRNPYTRLISEYYCNWTGSKNKNTKNKDEFNKWICNLINRNYGVSGLPQYLYSADHVLKFENLQEDFTNLMNKFNIDDVSIPHSNKSTQTNKFTIDDMYIDTIEMINNKYHQDFIKFGYNMIKY
jgi:hypothetical protein